MDKHRDDFALIAAAAVVGVVTFTLFAGSIAASSSMRVAEKLTAGGFLVLTYAVAVAIAIMFSREGD